MSGYEDSDLRDFVADIRVFKISKSNSLLVLRFYWIFMRCTNGTSNKNTMKDKCNETVRFRNLVETRGVYPQFYTLFLSLIYFYAQ